MDTYTGRGHSIIWYQKQFKNCQPKSGKDNQTLPKFQVSSFKWTLKIELWGIWIRIGIEDA